MSSLRPEDERRICGVLCICFSSLMFALLVFETLMNARGGRYTLAIEFLEKSSMGFAGGFFLTYLILGGLGLFGAFGVIEQYGHHDSLVTRAVRAAGFGFFLFSYWCWGAVFIVQHKLTLLTDRPSNPPDWLLQNFESISDALFALFGWGRIGPALILYTGLGLMLWRGARLLPRAAAVTFLAIAIVRLLQLLYLTVRGVGAISEGSFDLLDLADKFFWFGDIVGFILAGVALITEKGIFVRTRRA